MKRKTKKAVKGIIKWSAIAAGVLVLLYMTFLGGRWMWFVGVTDFMQPTPVCIEQELEINGEIGNYAMIDVRKEKNNYKLYKDMSCDDYMAEYDKYVPKDGIAGPLTRLGGFLWALEFSVLIVVIGAGIACLSNRILSPIKEWFKKE